MRKRWMIAIFLLALGVALGNAQQTGATHKKKAKSSSARTVTPQTAQSETSTNTAGSIAGNSGAIGTTTGDTKPQDPSTPQKSAADNHAPASGQTAAQDAQQAQPAAENASHVPGEAAGEKSSAANASGIGMLPDTDARTLQSEIDSALKSDPALANSQLSVNVNDAQITINGTVPTGKEKLTATRIVQSYAGNRRVTDKIDVAGHPQKPAPEAQPPNTMGANTPKR